MNEDYLDTMSIVFNRPSDAMESLSIGSNPPDDSEPVFKQAKLSPPSKLSEMRHLGLMYEEGGIKAYLEALRSRQSKTTHS